MKSLESTSYNMQMNLQELFETVSPCVVGFISRLTTTLAGNPRPIFPPIFATGFLATKTGIVVTNRHVEETFSQVPNHPRTGESALAAILWFPGDPHPDRHGWQLLTVDIRAHTAMSEFTSSDNWYGRDIPDIGFVQLGVKDVPCLELASDDFYVKTGMSIATVGYPMGTRPLTVLGRMNQMTPFMRHGIVSSVFPFPGARPHGFTIDVMQQGGSSGSPIFRADDPKVIGMMSSGIMEVKTARSTSASLEYAQSTNISIAEPAHIIKLALDWLQNERWPDSSTYPTLQELRDRYPQGSTTEGLTWESWTA